MHQRVIAIIPARAGSRRLPHKLLQPLGGRPVIAQVERRVRQSGLFAEVWVATDDAGIAEAVRAAGGQALRVDAPCTSGTERVAHAAARLQADLVINVQGDEPFVHPDDLAAVVQLLRGGAPIATLAAPLQPADRDNRAVVKVVRDARGRALYFSRAAIPGERHLGVYGFTAAALSAVAFLPRGPLAAAEDLEQLAWLEAGWPIEVADGRGGGPSIDTPADLAAARHLWTQSPLEAR